MPAFELLTCKFQCRLCGDEIVSVGDLVTCRCGGIKIDACLKGGFIRRTGEPENFISLCEWRSVETAQVFSDQGKFNSTYIR